MSDLYIYWCPRCEQQSQKPIHFCESGPPLIPQLDEETVCLKIPVITVERAEKIAEKVEKLEAELQIERGSHKAVVEEAAGYRRALMHTRDLDEDDFQSAWHYQQAVRFHTNSALLEPKSVPHDE